MKESEIIKEAKKLFYKIQIIPEATADQRTKAQAQMIKNIDYNLTSYLFSIVIYYNYQNIK